MASSKSTLQDTHHKGVATILAIGTANPPNCFHQSEYPDFYFQVTKSQHMTQLKHKYQRICERSAIKKRYIYLTEDMIKENPNLGIYKAPSLDFRQEILVREVPKLGKEAALKAIEEWGQPVSKITHLIFCTSCCVNAPSADHQLAKLIGLKPSAQKFMIFGQGCSGGGSALRLSKDLAENNANARVLIVCSELTLMSFHAPSETQLGMLVGSAIFSDGAAALIVGAHPDINLNEWPLFQIISAKQTVIPDSDTMVKSMLREMGMEYFLSKDLPKCIENNVEQCLIETFTPFGIGDWNTLFYAVHPGGAAVLKGIEEKLGLRKDKLKASRHVLTEYGNMRSPSVFFALDEIRKKSVREGKTTTGEGLECGVLWAFGPGLTVETAMLRSCALGYSAN